MKFPSFDLTGKTAIVTGGGRGIGEVIAHSLAHFGASVAIVDKNVADAKAVTEQIGREGSKSIAVEADITDLKQIAGMVKTVVDSFGGIDILVNNAAIVVVCPAEELTPEDWDKTMAVDLRGLFFCSQAVGKQMIKQQKKGKIINIAAVSALMALRPLIAYNSAKGGVISLTKSLAIDWAKYGINVNAIAPTFIKTKMIKSVTDNPALQQFLLRRIPLGRLGEPEDIAGAVIYLASPAADMVTGHTLIVDGGWTAGERGAY